MKYVHRDCLDRWRRSSPNRRSFWVHSVALLRSINTHVNVV
jgi:hypothetical protein